MRVITKDELEKMIRQTGIDSQNSNAYYQAKLSVLGDLYNYVTDKKGGTEIPDVEPVEDEKENVFEPQPDTKDEEPEGKFKSGEEVSKEEMNNLQKPRPLKVEDDEDKVWNPRTNKWEPKEKVEKDLEDEDRFGE